MKCSIRLLNFVNKLIFGETRTPLPWKITLTVFCLMLFNAMTLTMVFSFMPKLIKSFGTSEVNTGYQVGLVSGSMFLGRIFFSLLWGYLADVYGKKKLSITSALCLSITTLAFGLSYNIAWAVITRALQGMSMGLLVILKGIIMDICDDTNSSIGMAFILGAYSFGLVVGPIIGGFLSFPGDLYPGYFQRDSFFKHFGVILPNIVVSLGLLVSSGFGFIFLPTDYSIEQKQRRRENRNISSKTKQLEYLLNERSYLIRASIKNDDSCEKNYDIKITKSIVLDLSKQNKKCSKSRYGKLFSNKNCLMICIQYGVFSMFTIGFDELFPLYAATSQEYNGLGFKTSEIGTALMILSCITTALQFTVMTKIVDFFGLKKSYMYSCIICFVMMPLIPLCKLITFKYVSWTVMLLIMLIIRFWMSTGFLCINVMLNHSVTSDLSGSANGLGEASATIGRCIAVPTIGSLFSWSLTNIKSVTKNKHAIGFPFNQYMMFIALSLIILISAISSLLLPKSLNQKQKVNNAA